MLAAIRRASLCAWRLLKFANPRFFEKLIRPVEDVISYLNMVIVSSLFGQYTQIFGAASQAFCVAPYHPLGLMVGQKWVTPRAGALPPKRQNPGRGQSVRALRKATLCRFLVARA